VFEIAGLDVVAGLLHLMQVEMQVVQRRKRPAEGFLCLEQVARVGAGIVPAAVAVAFRVERAAVIGKFGVLVAEHSPAGVNKAVLRILGGQNAIEHVDAAGNKRKQVPGRAHPPALKCRGGLFSIFSLWIFLFYTINYTCFLFSPIIVVISQNFSHQGYPRHIFNLYYKTQTICIAVIRFAIS